MVETILNDVHNEMKICDSLRATRMNTLIKKHTTLQWELRTCRLHFGVSRKCCFD